MYYGRNGAGAHSRELAGDANQAHGGEPAGTRADSTTRFAQRTNWAWAATARHDDWMDSHTPFAHYD